LNTPAGLGIFQNVAFRRFMTLADTSNSHPVAYFWLLFPVFFVGMWCFVCLVLSQLGGWAALGKHFRTDRTPTGVVFYGQSAQLSYLCSYNNCLTMIVTEEGLYLKVWPMFRIGHPPLLIPWEQIGAAKPHNFLWLRQVSFTVGQPPIATMKIPEKVFSQFQQTSR
jgi:hypothetical protein